MSIRNILISALLCIIANGCLAQNTKKKSMAEMENLRGKVKSVCNTQGKNLGCTYFNEEGRIVRHEMKYSNSTYIKKDYVYDTEGKLLSYKEYEEAKPNEVLSEMVYTYNDKGQLISYGNKSLDFNTYAYNDKGNCILEIRDGRHNGKRIKKTYNKKNQLIEELSYTIPPTQEMHTSYKYNAYGDVSSMVQKYFNNVATSQITYEYDSHQNWTKRKSTTKVTRNGKAEKAAIVTEDIRIVAYYE